MKKKNILIGLATLVGTGLACWMGYKTFKKELRKAKEEEKEIAPETVEEEQHITVGGNEEEVETPLRKIDPANFVADLALRMHEEFEDQMFDLDSCLRNDNTIHVRKMNKSLDILLQVPVGVPGVPNIGEFTTALKDATEITWTEHVKYTEQPFGQYEAWMIINYTDQKGVRRSGMIKVPKDIKDLFRKRDADGAIVKEKPAFVESRCVEKINKGAKIELIETEEQKDPVIVKAILLWRISYYIGNQRYTGINLESAYSALKYLMNDVTIDTRESSKPFMYDNIVFYEEEYPVLKAWTFDEVEGKYTMNKTQLHYSEKK